MTYRYVILWWLTTFATFAQTPPGPAPAFTDVTKPAGINHQFRVYEGMFGGGACVFDFDRDGFEDVYVTGGMNDDQLYRNNHDGTFTNVFEKSGLTVTRNFVTQGVTSADVNRDGWVDLFVTTITKRPKNNGPGGEARPSIPRAMNLLFLNNGNKTFRDATKDYGLDQLVSFSTGASFGDINADGWPDLYVGNYFNNFQGELTYINDATIVSATQTSKGYLLLNRAGKRFEDVYDDYKLTHKGFGFGGVFSDVDNDGDQDLLVNHDFGYKRTPNLLLENQYPRRSFRDVGPAANMDLKINSMGTAVGDVNNDGLMDYLFTNIRYNRLMVSNGIGKGYTERTEPAGMMYMSISWGANFADFDHDGDLDLFVANGDLNPNCVPMADYYFQNLGGPQLRFEDVAYKNGLNDYGIGRGSVVFDYDRDGDLDLLVVNQAPVKDYPVPSATRLYRNDRATGNWLQIRLKGVQAESQGIGSRIEVVAGGRHLIREVDGGGSSHVSQNSTIAHVGLGTANVVDSVMVTWTGGKRQILLRPKINTLLTITETPDPPISPLVWAAGLAGVGGLVAGGYVLWRKKRRATNRRAVAS